LSKITKCDDESKLIFEYSFKPFAVKTKIRYHNGKRKHILIKYAKYKVFPSLYRNLLFPLQTAKRMAISIAGSWQG
jgi:hypothetical protein